MIFRDLNDGAKECHKILKIKKGGNKKLKCKKNTKVFDKKLSFTITTSVISYR